MWRDILKEKGEKKGGSVSADFLSTSLINAESRILAVFLGMCMCVFEKQMTRAALE